MIGCQEPESSYTEHYEKSSQSQKKVVVKEQQVEGETKEETEVKLTKEPIGLRIKRNPFLTMEEEEPFRHKRGEVVSYLNLSAIFYSPPYSYAIVNGRIVKKGDLIDGKEVTEINPEEIVLNDSGGRCYVAKVRRIVN